MQCCVFTHTHHPLHINPTPHTLLTETVCVSAIKVSVYTHSVYYLPMCTLTCLKTHLLCFSILSVPSGHSPHTHTHTHTPPPTHTHTHHPHRLVRSSRLVTRTQLTHTSFFMTSTTRSLFVGPPTNQYTGKFSLKVDTSTLHCTCTCNLALNVLLVPLELHHTES